MRYGVLTVECLVGVDRGGSALWRCRCDCGNERVVSAEYLQSGAIQSCGCTRKGVPVQTVEVDGQRMTIRAAAMAAGLDYDTVRMRLNRGASVEEALRRRETIQTIMVEIDGRVQSMAAWAAENGIPVRNVWQRLRFGWDPVRIVTRPVQRQSRRKQS
jgi:hypothetical protein